MKKTPTNGDAPKKHAPKMGSGCLILFAIPFAGVGVFMLGSIVRDLWVYRSAQSWEATPATLLAAELKLGDGDGGSTYCATARYRYEYGGKAYIGNRVALYQRSDNIGDFQEKHGNALVRKFAQRQPVTAYVNPANPGQAMLFRQLRPEVLAFHGIFVLVFGGAGFGLIAAGVEGEKILRREKKLRRQYPAEPWRWKEEWLGGRLRSSDFVWIALIAALFWNVITWPVCIASAFDDSSRLLLLITSVFVLVGLWLATWAGYLWMQRWKWGVSEFEMATVPGSLGGPLAGVIRVPRRIQSESGIQIRLACERWENEGDSKRKTTVWEEERTLARDLTTDDGKQSLIPVQFIIPFELPDSGAEGVTWGLSAFAKTAGVDYKSQFEVPIFRTAASSPMLMTVEIDDGNLFAPVTLASIASGASARLAEDLPDRKQLVFPMARQRGLSFGITLFTLIWIGVCVGLFYSDAPRFLAWVFSGCAVILLMMVVSTVFERTRLEFGARGVTYMRRIAGIGRERSVAPEEIVSVTATKSGASFGATTYWKVELTDRSGVRHKLATAIPRRQLAERLAEVIAAAVGLSQSRNGSEASRMDLKSELPAELWRG